MKFKAIRNKMVAFLPMTCAILSVVLLGLGVAYLWGWAHAAIVIGALIWVDLTLAGRSNERNSGGSQVD